MKKVFLMLAFAGLVGSISASVNFDDKDKGKKECKKDGKCCKAGDGKTCTASDKKACEKKEGKCCKAKTTEAKPAGSK